MSSKGLGEALHRTLDEFVRLIHSLMRAKLTPQRRGFGGAYDKILRRQVTSKYLVT